MGNISAIGLGSGDLDGLTPEALAAINDSEVIVGYSRYLKFIESLVGDREVISSGMKGEIERCDQALEVAAQGKKVCVVCSGDAGILAMAGLLFELRDLKAAYHDIVIDVVPGVTAANIAAAVLGAPFQKGFCLISLSDLLTPRPEIETNLKAIAPTQLGVALYNPAGRKRRELLNFSLDLFKAERGDDTIAAIVRNAGRPDESKWIGPISEFPEEKVDMLSLVVIGNSTMKQTGDQIYDPRGYVEKYLNS